MKKTPMLRGTCLCGTVAYEIRGAPLLMYYCHCSTCRKATASSFATNLAVRSKAPWYDILDGLPQKPGTFA